MRDVLTVRLEKEIKGKLDKLAKATARTKSFLVADAIREYIELNEWQVEAIQEGIREADAGRLLPHATVRAKWERKRAD
jgi:RHH-type transcriptional regulator, rel operon repressor / antitoxin RelB